MQPEDGSVTVIRPVDRMVRENTGIDLLILPEAEDMIPVPATQDNETVTSGDGKKIPVLRTGDKPEECVFLLSEGSNGMLKVTLKQSGQ